MFQLLQNLNSQETAGYAISVLLACDTQICGAITEADTSLVGLRYSPLTFGRHDYARQRYVLTFLQYQPLRHRKRQFTSVKRLRHPNGVVR